jgi:DNA polymerase IIIc chi subunit
MSELTNSGIDLGVASPSIEDRMAAFVNNEPALSGDDEASPPQEEAAPQDAPQDQAQSEELTADDLTDESEAPAQSAGETVFEIVHNGQTHKIASREEQIKYMQQGFDYTQKTQALAQDRAQVQEAIQRSQEMVQLAPMVAQDLATVKALESQLKQFQQVDWVQLATNDPLEYPKWRAQFDQLQHSYQGAVGQLQRNAGALHQHQAAIGHQTMQQETSKMSQVVPEWQDQARYQKEAPEIVQFLLSRGLPQEAVAALGRNPGDALLTGLARDAWLYNRLKADKAGKVKQLRNVPPVPKPGAPSSAKSEQSLKARDVHKKIGTRESAANLLLTRMGK